MQKINITLFYKSNFSVFLIMLSFISCKIERQAYTIATTEINRGPQKTPLYYEYFVNGKRYLRYGYEGEVSEKFRVVYDSLHPGRARVDFEEPLFLPNEQVVKTTGTILKASKRECKFEYHSKASSKPHKKIQMYYKGTRKKYRLKKGMKFEVEYSPYNAQRAIIYFDKPIQ